MTRWSGDIAAWVYEFQMMQKPRRRSLRQPIEVDAVRIVCRTVCDRCTANSFGLTIWPPEIRWLSGSLAVSDAEYLLLDVIWRVGQFEMASICQCDAARRARR